MPALWLERKRLYSGAEEIDSAWTKWGELREADFRGHCFTDDVLRSALVGCPKLELVLLQDNTKITKPILNLLQEIIIFDPLGIIQ